jgi:hypothetical protein
MPKVIIETVGPYMYMDVSVRGIEQIHHDRPSVVTHTAYLANLIARSLVTLLRAGLPESANDVDFQKVLVEAGGDTELAVEAYVSELTDEPEAEPKPKGRKPKEA